ncbi:MAG: hypothetical protein ACLQSR_01680 [Limisphaerales bacterium]
MGKKAEKLKVEGGKRKAGKHGFFEQHGREDNKDVIGPPLVGCSQPFLDFFATGSEFASIRGSPAFLRCQRLELQAGRKISMVRG